MDNNKFPKGVMAFKPNDKAPDFIIAEVTVTPDDLQKYMTENPDFVTEWNGKKQIRLTIKDGKKGYYAEVNTWKPTNQADKKKDETFNDSQSWPF